MRAILLATLLAGCAPDESAGCDTSKTAAGAATREKLIAGAFTDVPPSANAAHKSLVTGGPLHIVSAITGAEFHVRGKISSEPGGLSATPQPILKRADGVDYWFVSGELSGVCTVDIG